MSDFRLKEDILPSLFPWVEYPDGEPYTILTWVEESSNDIDVLNESDYGVFVSIIHSKVNSITQPLVLW